MYAVVIQAVLQQIRALDARRVAGFLALLAVAVVVLAGSAHAIDAGAHGDHGCTVCFAAVTTAGAALPAPAIVLVADGPDRSVPASARVSDVARTNVRLPASRAPPAGA